MQEHKFWEEAFQAYERGVALFKYPHSKDIWAAYLSHFVARYKGTKLERARDLFKQALSQVRCRPRQRHPVTAPSLAAAAWPLLSVPSAPVSHAAMPLLPKPAFRQALLQVRCRPWQRRGDVMLSWAPPSGLQRRQWLTRASPLWLPCTQQALSCL